MNRKAFKHNKPVSKDAKRAFEQSYQLIREQQIGRKPAAKKQSVWMLRLVVVAVVVLIISLTPVGLAIEKMLGFDKIESETLRENGFIVPQNSVMLDEDVTVSLVGFYADDNEVGLHLEAVFPEGHKLLNKNLETPSISMLLVDEGGNDLGETFSGQKNASLNQQTRTLNFFYELTSNSSDEAIFEKLNNAKLKIYRIGAIYKEQKEEMEPGFHMLEGEDVEGEWTLQIDTTKLKQFKKIEYVPNPETTIGVHKFLVSPTKVTIQFEHDYFSANNIDVSDGNNMSLIAVKGNEEKELPIESIQMVDSANSDFYPQVSFDFGGYDSYDKFILTIKGTQEASFTVKE